MAAAIKELSNVPNSSQETLWRRVERILPTVTKPGRYVGGELNQVVKSWDSVRTHIALVFPDIYDLGQSNPRPDAAL